MTAMQEARLAREAEMCYAALVLVTDYDCWHRTVAAVDIGEILRVMKLNVDNGAKRGVGTGAYARQSRRGHVAAQTRSRTRSSPIAR